jgi:hypothetical protein
MAYKDAQSDKSRRRINAARRRMDNVPRTMGYRYGGREMLMYLLNPAFLCKQWPWYADFLVQNEMRREALRRSGMTARYDSRLGGYNRTRDERAQAAIPSIVLNIMLLCDTELDIDEKKFAYFLEDHPEFSLEVRV